jgi:hypothetical protein
MSDESTSTPVTTDSNPLVSQVFESVKPYDMLDVYEEESAKEEAEAADESDVPKVKSPEVEDPESSKLEAKGTKDDKIIDGVEELPIKRMVNGKEIEFKIKDAIESHVKKEEFNRNMDRRVGEISRRERAWQDDQNNFKSKVQKVIEVTQSGDFVSGIRALAKLAAGSSSLDVSKFEKMYFDQLDSVRKVYSEMTPEQQEAYFAKRSLAEARSETERLRNEKAAHTAQSELQSEVTGLMRQHGLPEAEFWGNYKVLADTLVGEGKPFQHPNEITAEDVTKYSLDVKHWEKVLTAGDRLGVTDDAILDEVGRITATYPDLTVEDVEKVIKNAGLASPAAVENLNRKAGSSRLSSSANSTKKQNAAEGYDEDSLDFLYRNQPKAYNRVSR